MAVVETWVCRMEATRKTGRLEWSPGNLRLLTPRKFDSPHVSRHVYTRRIESNLQKLRGVRIGEAGGELWYPTAR